MKCRVKEIFRKYVIVEHQGKGYKLNFSDTNSLKTEEEYIFYLFEEFKLELKNHITSQLFAFLTKEEHELFQLLLTIKGIGSKTAQKILTNDWTQIAVLANREDRLNLAGLKGFSLQLADTFINFYRSSKILQQILLIRSEDIRIDERAWSEEELITSLMEIGYRQSEIQKTLNILKTRKTKFHDLNSVINECLKTMSQSAFS